MYLEGRTRATGEDPGRAQVDCSRDPVGMQVVSSGLEDQMMGFPARSNYRSHSRFRPRSHLQEVGIGGEAEGDDEVGERKLIRVHVAQHVPGPHEECGTAVGDGDADQHLWGGIGILREDGMEATE